MFLIIKAVILFFYSSSVLLCFLRFLKKARSDWTHLISLSSLKQLQIVKLTLTSRCQSTPQISDLWFLTSSLWEGHSLPFIILWIVSICCSSSTRYSWFATICNVQGFHTTDSSLVSRKDSFKEFCLPILWKQLYQCKSDLFSLKVHLLFTAGVLSEFVGLGQLDHNYSCKLLNFVYSSLLASLDQTVSSQMQNFAVLCYRD